MQFALQTASASRSISAAGQNASSSDRAASKRERGAVVCLLDLKPDVPRLDSRERPSKRLVLPDQRLAKDQRRPRLPPSRDGGAAGAITGLLVVGHGTGSAPRPIRRRAAQSCVTNGGERAVTCTGAAGTSNLNGRCDRHTSPSRLPVGLGAVRPGAASPLGPALPNSSLHVPPPHRVKRVTSRTLAFLRCDSGTLSRPH